MLRPRRTELQQPKPKFGGLEAFFAVVFLADERNEWRFCHRPDGVGRRTGGHRHAPIRGLRTADMASAIAVADEQVEVEVVGVRAVIAGPKHRVELAAGAGEDSLQEGPLLRRPAPPAAADSEIAAVGETE